MKKALQWYALLILLILRLLPVLQKIKTVEFVALDREQLKSPRPVVPHTSCASSRGTTCTAYQSIAGSSWIQSTFEVIFKKKKRRREKGYEMSLAHRLPSSLYPRTTAAICLVHHRWKITGLFAFLKMQRREDTEWSQPLRMHNLPISLSCHQIDLRFVSHS